MADPAWLTRKNERLAAAKAAILKPFVGPAKEQTAEVLRTMWGHKYEVYCCRVDDSVIDLLKKK